MVIIDGADLVGKTTLQQAVVRELNNLGFCHIPLHLSKLPDSFHRVRGYLPLMTKDVVWDRFFASRQAYGRVLDNQELLFPEEIEHLQSCTDLVCAFRVLVLGDENLIRQNYRKDEMYDLDSVLQVNEVFRREISEQPWLWHMIIDARKMWPSEYASSIVSKYVERRLTLEQIYS